jgi:multiple sugar transport system ATP-binding protein
MIFPKSLWTEEMPDDDEFDCVLGIRPEKLTISTSEIQNRIGASIYSVQPAGSETTIHVIAGKTSLLIKTMGIKSYSMDQAVWLDTDLSKIIVFSKRAGKLIKRAIPD